MRGWITLGSLILAIVTFVLLWVARSDYRSLGCTDTPDASQCADALNSVYLYGGAGAVFALIALFTLGRKGR